MKPFTVLHYTGLYTFSYDLKPIEEAAAMGNFYITNRFDHTSLNVTVMKKNVSASRQILPNDDLSCFIWGE